MIISISGIQGQGKSQVLSGLKEHGVMVLPMSDPQEHSTASFFDTQNALVESKRRELESVRKQNKNVVIETSFIDIAVFTMFWVANDFEYADRLDDLFWRCVEYQNYIDLIVKLPFERNKNYASSYMVAASLDVLNKHFHFHSSPKKYREIELPPNTTLEEDKIDFICKAIVGEF